MLLGSGFLITAFGNPVKTVPWNGYKGATSFTFDDGLYGQLINVPAALKSRNIAATFFVPVGLYSPFSLTEWVAVAKEGNEISNHTVHHYDLTTLDYPSLVNEIEGGANVLRALDPSIEANTIAYPFSKTNAIVEYVADMQGFAARSCDGTSSYIWNELPQRWMAFSSVVVYDDASYNATIDSLEHSSRLNEWIILLYHEIADNEQSVTPAQLNSLFDKAIEDSLWVAPFGTVAAYWRASAELDRSIPQATAGGWTIEWNIPHPRMPKSVVLRINLDHFYFGNNIRVYQGDSLIEPEPDGSFRIEFMKKNLVIRKTLSISGINNNTPQKMTTAQTQSENQNALSKNYRSISGRFLGDQRGSGVAFPISRKNQ